MSRKALDGFVLGDVEKDFLLNLIKRLSRLYFSEIIGFTIMGDIKISLREMRRIKIGNCQMVRLHITEPSWKICRNL
jgi:hypothetical protein